MTAPTQPKEVIIASPACLPLGAVTNNGQPALLGVTISYPPIQMLFKPLGELSVTGGRAPLARAQAQRWFESHQRPPKAEIEIELTIPLAMGLGSDALMGLSISYGLAALAGGDPHTSEQLAVNVGSEWALEANCQGQGGVQVVNLNGAGARRKTLQHAENLAWVFVIYMPRITNQTPPSLETDRRLALLQAAQTNMADVAPLWDALEAENIEAFATELMRIHEQTNAALASLGVTIEVPEESQRVMQAIQQTGGLAWGQSLGGLAVWGLYKGASPSQEGRMLMRHVVGFEGGTVTASVTDNKGIQVAVRE